MKTSPSLFTILFVPLAILGFTACDEPQEVAYPGGNSFGYQGQGSAQPQGPQYGAPYGQGTTPGGTMTDSRQVTSAPDPVKKGPSRDSGGGSTTSTSTTTTTTTPPSGPAGTPTYPKGIPVPDKPGFVMSPYTKPGDGYVDVRGYPPGMEVKDPYTGGVFLVP